VIGWSLAAVSFLWGFATFWVFRHFSDRTALRVVRKRIYGHLLGIRLFSDEPALVWNAQKALISDNLLLLKLLALPVLILALPFAFFYSQFEPIYGFRPLEVGHSAVITLHGTDATGVLEVPPGIAVETPTVRDLIAKQISWRIRPLTPVRGSLRVVLPDATITRNIAAGDQILSPKRLREPSAGPIWLEIDYPRSGVDFAGLSLPWIAWFLILSGATALAFTLWPRRSYAKAAHPATNYPIRSS
jgi:hypothetical protein